jgi:cytochrome P450
VVTILAALEAARADVDPGGEPAGTVRVPGFATAVRRSLVPVLAQPSAEHPAVGPRIHEHEPAEALELLAADEIDLALVYDYTLAPVRDDGKMDALGDFAGPFAARTLKLLLGLHAARDEDLEFAAQAFIDVGNYADDADTWQRCERANRLVDEAVTADWDPGADGTVLSALIEAGTRSEEEVRANVKLFVSGGLNEPRDVIATTLHALLADPQQEALAREDPENLAKATEESLRWTSPIGMFPRVVHEDTELGGVHLTAGTRIGVLIASANRDERHWEEPDRFDLRRGVRARADVRARENARWRDPAGRGRSHHRRAAGRHAPTPAGGSGSRALRREAPRRPIRRARAGRYQYNR